MPKISENQKNCRNLQKRIKLYCLVCDTKKVPADFKDTFLKYNSCYSNISFPCMLEFDSIKLRNICKKSENKQN